MDRPRQELLEGLHVDKHGIIQTHGQYFLERVFIPYFWEKAKRKEYDEIYTDIRNQKWYQFRVREEHRKEYPELGTISIVRVRIQQYVVCSWTMSGLNSGASG